MTKAVWFTTLAQELVEAYTTGGEVSLHGHRIQTIDCLENVLIDGHCLHRHCVRLAQLWGHEPPQFGRFPKEKEAVVLREGLTALYDNELCALVVDPVALYGLFSEIQTTWPAAWLRIIDEHDPYKHAPKSVTTSPDGKPVPELDIETALEEIRDHT